VGSGDEKRDRSGGHPWKSLDTDGHRTFRALGDRLVGPGR